VSVNQIVISGNVTRKPTLRYTPNGYAVTDLSVAENYRRRENNSDEWRDVATTYYSVTCWRHLAEHVTQSLDKGHPVVVVGRLFMDEWIDRDGGLRRAPKIDPVSVSYDLRVSGILAPARNSSGPDRDQIADRRQAETWQECPDGEPDTAGDPFDPDAVESDDEQRTVGAVPASEA
jgi:single-strand DNA-binding protein